MVNSNEQTLAVYQRHFDRYLEGTAQVTEPDHAQGKWIADILEKFPKDAKILEIGSAMGRDARYMQELGYNPEVTDAFDAAVAFLRESGWAARKLNILTDDIEGQYDLIFAAAVFLHLTKEEFTAALLKLRNHISENGLLAFSLKSGEGEEWQDHKMGEARYFRFWNEATLLPLLNITGYRLVDVRTYEDGKWLHVITEPGVKNGN